MPRKLSPGDVRLLGHFTQAVYEEFCRFQGFTPVEPCPWDIERAMAYRRGQRERDRLDRAARLAARYCPPEPQEPMVGGVGAVRERLAQLERDISALLMHRHQEETPRAQDRPLTKGKPLEWIK